MSSGLKSQKVYVTFFMSPRGDIKKKGGDIKKQTYGAGWYSFFRLQSGSEVSIYQRYARETSLRSEITFRQTPKHIKTHILLYSKTKVVDNNQRIN